MTSRNFTPLSAIVFLCVMLVSAHVFANDEDNKKQQNAQSQQKSPENTSADKKTYKMTPAERDALRKQIESAQKDIYRKLDKSK